MTEIHGECAAGFEPVRAAFEENFAERGEIGAAFSVTRHGETVVDLWAGWADPDRTTRGGRTRSPTSGRPPRA
ncbi:serine hydrolase [Amycolatopsis lurida]|uniref:serine hydrolase n=1 Tax=Amycolatopsis lurida TaxID=31959 RepID=UPI000ACDD652|nr:serine hydrolase [Amycolatopsis lurida]